MSAIATDTILLCSCHVEDLVGTQTSTFWTGGLGLEDKMSRWAERDCWILDDLHGLISRPRSSHGNPIPANSQESNPWGALFNYHYVLTSAQQLSILKKPCSHKYALSTCLTLTYSHLLHLFDLFVRCTMQSLSYLMP